MNLKTWTWNILWGFISDDNYKSFQKFDIDYYVWILKKANLDLIFLQEAHLNQTKYIADKLSYKYYTDFELSPSHLKKWEKLCLWIISKYKIENIENIFFINLNLKCNYKWNEIYSHDKGFIKWEIFVWNTKFQILCSHFLPLHIFWIDYNNSLIKNYKKDIIEKIFNNSLENTIFWVDTNVEDEEKYFSEFRKNWYKNIFNKNHKWNASDIIFISNKLNFENIKIYESLGDHCLRSWEVVLD